MLETNDEGRAAVLVVEDEILIADMVTEALTDAGFEVCTVATAAEALRCFVDGYKPDILLTDINLPGGMDGALLASCARTLHPDLAVVYASGRRAVEEIETVPGSVFVPKPYSPLAMCSLLRDIAHRHAHPAPTPH
jgi:DNA-binding response OmpR family regulator